MLGWQPSSRNMTVFTRRAQPRDIEHVAALFDAYRQFYGMPADFQRAFDYVGARVENSESVILVAEDGVGGIFGFCQIYPTFCSVFTSPLYTLYDLFVAPEARGRGVGKALLAAAERCAVEAGAVRMELRTAKTNAPAQALYESSGWVRDEVFDLFSIEPRSRFS